MNRLHFESDCPACSAAASAEQLQIQQLLAGIEVPCSAWGIELFAEEVRGQELLSGFWEHARPISGTPVSPAQPELSLRAGRAASGGAPVSARCGLSCLPAKAAWARRRSRAPPPCGWPRDFPGEAGSALLDRSGPLALRLPASGNRPPADACCSPGLTAMEIDAAGGVRKAQSALRRGSGALSRFHIPGLRSDF